VVVVVQAEDSAAVAVVAGKRFILKINWFAKIAKTNTLILSKNEVYIDQSGNVYIDQSGNVYIDHSGNTKLVFKVLNYQEMYYQDIYSPEHLSS
jgi:hypothetical protein